MNPVATTVIMQTCFADTPVSCTCPSCRQNVISRIVYNTGLLAWLIFGILCLLGCWLGCCLIPFCVDSCKDVDHFCPNCNHHLAKYKRL
ncbi:Possible membrane-associated motif in LPS-induced tumor necrosis factor alpha factor (LITAF) [Pristimantis euphronides]